MHCASVWGSSRSRALVRCASSSWVCASPRAIKNGSSGGAPRRSASDNALLLGIQVKTPLALAELRLTSDSFRACYLCRQSLSSFETCAPIHVSKRAADWHEYLVKVRSRGLPLVQHASRRGGCVYTDLEFLKRTSLHLRTDVKGTSSRSQNL